MNWYLKVLGKYATFDGRARRQEYWMFTLVNFVIVVALAIISVVLGKASPKAFIVMDIVLVIYLLLILLSSLGVTVRRLHDTNRSGWWFWISLVPFVGGIILFVFTVLDSAPGSNLYDPSPKAV